MEDCNYVKQGYIKIQEKLDQINDLYTFNETKQILQLDNYYKILFGKAKNRTIIKENPRLYKSIYKHSSILEKTIKNQNSYKGQYSFRYRILFIVQYNGDIEKLKCSCGRKYNFTKYCRHCPDYKRNQLGKPHTQETKLKMRQSTLEYIKSAKGACVPRYNKSSIPIIKQYEKKHGYNFQHAENNGEYQVLGYFVDAYDHEKNTVLEIDEKHHYNVDGTLKDRDIQRQKEIEDFLNCKFIRISV